MEQKIKGLLNEESWELKTLEEISEKIFSGIGVEEKDKGTGVFPAMKTGDLSSLRGMTFDTCSTFIDCKLVDKSKTFSYGDILMIGQSGSINIVGKCYLYLGEDICAAGGGIHVIKHTQNPRWFIYIINSLRARKQIFKLAKQKHVGGMPNRINISELKKIKIPLPSLENQEKIVSVLDEFTQSLTNMQEKIDLLKHSREQQYKYFSNKAFS